MTFAEAIKTLDVDYVKSALSAEIDPNTLVDGKHPLHVLVDLLHKDAQLSSKEPNPAILKIFELVLDAGADKDVQNEQAKTTLQRLCTTKTPYPMFNNEKVLPMAHAMIEKLLACGANTEISGAFGQTALAAALGQADETAAIMLLDAQANYQIHMMGEDMLTLACRGNMVQVVKKLLGDGSHTADFNVNAAFNASRNAEIIYQLLNCNARCSDKSRYIHYYMMALNENHHGLQSLLLLVVDIATVKLHDAKTLLHVIACEGAIPSLKIFRDIVSRGILRHLLSKGIDVNAQDNRGETAFSLLASNWLRLPEGDHERAEITYEMIKCLLTFSADPTITNSNGETPLHIVVSSSHVPSREQIQQLLAWGIDINKKDSHGKTALIKAIQWGKFQLASLLVEQSASCAVADANGSYPLETLKWDKVSFYLHEHEDNKTELLTLLVRLMSNFPEERLPSNANHLLHIATRLGAKDIILKLKEQGISLDVGVECSSGQMIMHTAARQSPAMVPWLLKLGAQSDIADSNGTTPLMLATYSLNKEAMGSLLNMGASPNARDTRERSVIYFWFETLTMFSQKKHIEEDEIENCKACFKLLINHGAKLGALSSDGRSLLDSICFEYYQQSWTLPLIHKLLRLGVPLPTDESLQQMLLKLAAATGDSYIVEQIVINHPENQQERLNTACRIGIDKNNIAVVNTTLTLGLDRSAILAPETKGLLDYSFSCRLNESLTLREPITRRLIEEVYSANDQDKLPADLLHRIAELGWVTTMEWLVDNDSSLDINKSLVFSSYIYTQAVTPLDVAVGKNQTGMVQYLLNHGVSCTSRIALFQTASEQGYVEIVKSFIEHGMRCDQSYTNKSSFIHYETTTLTETLRVYGTLNSKKEKPAPDRLAKLDEILLLLLEHKSSVRAEDIIIAINGKIPIEIIKKLREYLTSEQWLAIFPLHLAIKSHHNEVIEWLLPDPEHITTINETNHLGQTVLHLATQPGFHKLYKTLVENGASIEIRDNQGRDVLTYAIAHDNYQALGLMLPSGVSEKLLHNLTIILAEEREFQTGYNFTNTNLTYQNNFQRRVCSYQLARFFSSVEECKAYIKQYEHHKSVERIQDITRFHLPSPEEGDWDKKAWVKLILAATPEELYDNGIPILENYLHMAARIEKILKRAPKTIAEIKTTAARVKYHRFALNPEMATLFMEHHIPEFVFERVLDRYHKKELDFMPDIEIDGRQVDPSFSRYRLSKLPTNDLRGFILGKYTRCCQYVGGPGEACTWHGVTSPKGGFYVITKKANDKEIKKIQRIVDIAHESSTTDEFLAKLPNKLQRNKYRKDLKILRNLHDLKEEDDDELLDIFRSDLEEKLNTRQKGEILVQSWAWLCGDVLVLDSWERKNSEEDKLCERFLARFAHTLIFNHGFREVRIGSGGQTPNTLTFSKAEAALTPEDYHGYSDSHQQLIIANTETLLTTLSKKTSSYVKKLSEHPELIRQIGFFVSTNITTREHDVRVSETSLPTPLQNG